ncbi:MAG: hypothetical protein MPK13_09040, partial [Gammaproteobacteria bacterium]|nr:hypothetical protein [Gammaproteobacteria bacterium]
MPVGVEVRGGFGVECRLDLPFNYQRRKSMISDVKAVLKLAAAALLSFAAAPLYADGAPYVPPAQI